MLHKGPMARAPKGRVRAQARPSVEDAASGGAPHDRERKAPHNSDRAPGGRVGRGPRTHRQHLRRPPHHGARGRGQWTPRTSIFTHIPHSGAQLEAPPSHLLPRVLAHGPRSPSIRARWGGKRGIATRPEVTPPPPLLSLAGTSQGPSHPGGCREMGALAWAASQGRSGPREKAFPSSHSASVRGDTVGAPHWERLPRVALQAASVLGESADRRPPARAWTLPRRGHGGRGAPARRSGRGRRLSHTFCPDAGVREGRASSPAAGDWTGTRPARPGGDG